MRIGIREGHGAPVASVEGEADLERVAAEDFVNGAGGDGDHTGGWALVPREVAVGVHPVLLAHVRVIAN